MNYLAAINLDLQAKGINSKEVSAGSRWGKFAKYPDGIPEYLVIMIGEGIMMRIEQQGDVITMCKYRMRKPRKRALLSIADVVAGHPKYEWERYWERSYELADPENFGHAMDLILAWTEEGKNAETRSELVTENHRPPDYGERILKNCRHLVTPQDLFIHLGDVIFYQYPKLKEMLDSFPCRKILTMGNHDRQTKRWFQRNGFDIAVDAFVLDHVIFSHKPLHVLPSGVTINVHGHFHNTDHRSKEPQYNGWYDPTIHRLLAVEYTDYKPVELQWFLNQPPRSVQLSPSTTSDSPNLILKDDNTPQPANRESAT